MGFSGTNFIMKYGKFIKKAIFFSEDKIIALRFDTEDNKVIINGRVGELEEMDYLIYTVFGKIKRIKSVAKNSRKLKYSFTSTLVDFNRRVDFLKTSLHVEDVKTYGRLLR